MDALVSMVEAAIALRAARRGNEHYPSLYSDAFDRFDAALDQVTLAGVRAVVDGSGPKPA